ncbi:hypothetical protein [Cognatiyoonia sp.]|uniref:hypothetical protein n=1 Tax=Cognatiyoonia sp. TaxID=2211652 RepID=UPI003F69C812
MLITSFGSRPQNTSAETQFRLQLLEVSWRKLADGSPQELDVNALLETDPGAIVLYWTKAGAVRTQSIAPELGRKLHPTREEVPFARLFDEPARGIVLELLDATFTLPAVVEILVVAKSRHIGRKIAWELILLLYAGYHTKPIQLLGVLLIDHDARLKDKSFEIDPNRSWSCDELYGATDVSPPTRPQLQLVVDNGPATPALQKGLA